MPDAVATYAGAPTSANGTNTNVVAGTVIAGPITLGIGRWEISVEASWGSTANVQDNIQLRVVQAGVTTLIPLKMAGGASSIPSINDRIVIQVFIGPPSAPNTTATVAVTAIGTDATGVYNVNLTARPLLV